MAGRDDGKWHNVMERNSRAGSTVPMFWSDLFIEMFAVQQSARVVSASSYINNLSGFSTSHGTRRAMD